MMPALFPVRSMDAVFRNNYADARSAGARVHQGIDIGVIVGGRRVTGATVLSATPGTVVAVGRETTRGEPRSGNSVTVRDPDGWLHHYAHLLTTPFVRAGQQIAAGTPLGVLGNTGNARSTAPHLHYQIERRGVRVNPYPALAAGWAAMRHNVPGAAQLGDGASSPSTEATATPEEREAAREVWRRLEPAFVTLLNQLEAWPQRTVWEPLYALQHGARAREARESLEASLPIARTLLNESRRLAREDHYIAALVQLRSACTLVGQAMAPMSEMQAELPDVVRATVASSLAFGEFFLPGSTTGYTPSQTLRTMQRRGEEAWDDASEAASSAGGLALLALGAFGLYLVSR